MACREADKTQVKDIEDINIRSCAKLSVASTSRASSNEKGEFGQMIDHADQSRFEHR